MRKIAKHGVMSVDARHPAQNGKKFDSVKIAWLLLCLLFSGHAHAADLKARLWPTATNTRLVIETPALAEFKIIDSITNPPRLVLDVAICCRPEVGVVHADCSLPSSLPPSLPTLAFLRSIQ